MSALVASLLALSPLLSSYSHAGTRLAAPAKREDAVLSAIRRDLATRDSTQFGRLLARWKKEYGVRAVTPLVKIASDTKAPDADRYVAVMGAGQLGGKALAKVISRFLSDPAWMVRSAALRALAALGDPSVGEKVLPLLRDPALVVRHEAVVTIEKLKPEGSIHALIAAAKDQTNYHGGKAQWVPQRALTALAAIGAPKGIAGELLPLLDHKKDLSLVKETVKTLAAVTGHTLSVKSSIEEQATVLKQLVRTGQTERPRRAPAGT